jgi:hypothetical protein
VGDAVAVEDGGVAALAGSSSVMAGGLSSSWRDSGIVVEARGWVLSVFEVEEEGLAVIVNVGVEDWMILVFTMETGGVIVVFSVEVEDWALLVFTTEEERLTIVRIADWVRLLLGCIWGWLDTSLVVKPWGFCTCLNKLCCSLHFWTGSSTYPPDFLRSCLKLSLNLLMSSLE